MKRMICVVVLLFFYTQASYAWWATGHALTAEIAREHLSGDVREVVDKRLSQGA